MTKESKKLLKYILRILFIIILILWLFFFFQRSNFIDNEITNPSSFSWDIFDGTWTIISSSWDEILSDSGLFLKQKEMGNYFEFNPPIQSRLSSDRDSNTNVLIQYLKNNTFIFRLPKQIQWWYLYIRLNNTLDKDEDVFINIYPKMSGKLLLEKWKSEFYIKLDDIKYKAYPGYTQLKSFNWIETMNYFNKNNYISMFYITNNRVWHIENIIITYTY